ncbi:LysM peptidoglycan-binding domain-containing protein [Dyella subtropica]|uniref:LysM peptidoglycan-binding domain-containing protein n=1 Tax=Dyella subtropica TaxID=2992127 RepID=UPI002252669C|nr:LysM peptidoglycan-binding domain-containing protein [Dyella subtropica]
MRPADSGSVAPYTPQLLPPQPQYTVQPHDTVQSVAKAHNVTPEELARTNRISVDSDISHIAALTLPPHAVMLAKDDQTQPPQTPAQKTDAATAAYDAAVKQRDDAMRNAPHNGAIRQDISTSESANVDQTQKAMDAAIKDEIGSQIATRNAGVPAEFQTPTDQVVKSAGDAIMARHQGDSVAQSAIGASVSAYQTQQKVDSLVPSFSGSWSAQDELARLSDNLRGQPQDVIDHVVADPRVQGWINDAAHEAAGKSSTDCAKYLADLVQNTQPDLARQVIEKWWSPSDPNDLRAQTSPIGVASYAASDADVYKNLASVYNALGDDPKAQALQQQIASTIANQQQDNPSFAQHTFTQAISDGGGAKLAIDVASQMQAAGKHDAALSILSAATLGTANLQKQAISQDMQDYAKQTQELNELIKDLGPGLTQEQEQHAINKYIQSKGKDWQDQFAGIKDKLVTDARAFSGDVGAMLNMPDNLKPFAPTREGLGKMLDDDTTRKAIAFAATQDPSIFEGKNAGEAAKLMLEVSHKNKEFVAAVGPAYVARNLLPALSSLNPNDPASVSKVNDALANLKDVAGWMGLPKTDIDEGTEKLKKEVEALQTESLDDAKLGKGINAVGATSKELSELKEMSFSSGASGMLFRAAALAISGGALLNQTGTTMDDPSTKNELAQLALSVGAVQDTAAFGAAVGAVDRNGSLGKWGLGANLAGQATEKFVGVLNVFYFANSAGEAASKNDVPTTLLSVAGLAGAGLTLFGGSEALGGLAGPIGFGIATVAALGIGVSEHYAKEREYKEAENKFLEGAGIENAGARSQLISVGGEQLDAMRARGMSPEQIQDIAENHPEWMHIAYTNDPLGRPY